MRENIFTINRARQYGKTTTLYALKNVLAGEYEADHHTGMDTASIAAYIHDYTDGYPFLVSRICQLADTEVSRKLPLADAWTRHGIDEAVKLILSENNTLFQSITAKLTNYPELRASTRSILMEGTKLTYNPDQEDISQLEMYGLIRNDHNTVRVANRIFETRLYNLFLSDEEMKNNVFSREGELAVSQGGMIAQWLAIDYPDKVERLVLAVTLARPNRTIRSVISRWSKMASRRDYKAIMLDTANRSYSEKRRRKARILYGLLGNIGRPKSFERFLIQAGSCLTHRAYDELPCITCPVLVIGGSDDRIVTGKASAEIADRIPGSRLYMYEGLGHGLYEEAPDFLDRVMDFCR